MVVFTIINLGQIYHVVILLIFSYFLHTEINLAFHNQQIIVQPRNTGGIYSRNPMANRHGGGPSRTTT